MGLEEKLLTVRLLCAIEFDIFLMWKDEAFARLLVEMTHFCVVYYGFSNPQNFCLFSILISYSQCYVLSFHLIIRSLSILLFHIRFLSSLFVLYFKFQSMVFFSGSPRTIPNWNSPNRLFNFHLSIFFLYPIESFILHVFHSFNVDYITPNKKKFCIIVFV